MKRHLFLAAGAAATIVLAGVPVTSQAVAPAATSARVTVGSPSDLTPRNHQNEPAVAIDAHAPDVLVAGTNDFIDAQPCPETTAAESGSCVPPSRTNTGVSGVYFSFDRGHTWTQPTYTGWTRRDCAPTVPCAGSFGPIGTLPWYYENGLVSFGDPAVAIGPRPVDGEFSWENGSRVYYANLAANFDAVLQPISQGPFKGLLGVAVSRLDDPTSERVQEKDNWAAPVIAIGRGGTFGLEDKEQVWADNAESSPFFGNVYVCSADFRAAGVPMMVAYSGDGGTTWTTRQATSTVGAGGSFFQHGSNTGCTIRTDSNGVVYLFYVNFRVGLPGQGFHVMQKSYDGGKHWTLPQNIFSINDMCYVVDPVEGRCVMDGYAGARIDLSAAPSVDIANGAPTGDDATNLIVDAWSDGRSGFNSEKTLLSASGDGGATWTAPAAVSSPGDRSMYSAPALSPDGSRAYVMYEGPTASSRGTDMTSPRPYHGVFRSAAVSGSTIGAWQTLYDGPL
ncbi:MAG TPA: sialidase family protein, partial [Actinomycetes bacterium]